MPLRTSANLELSRIAFGAFKIGRNQRTKHPAPYDLPDLAAVDLLLNGALDLGINVIDTAPAYGLSEERIGRVLAHRRGEFFLSTKVGERFAAGQSAYDYTGSAVRSSIHESLRRLQTEVLDLVLIHSNGEDQRIVEETDCVPTLQSLREQGLIRYIGMSGKSVAGARDALTWADAVMVEYHLNNRDHEEVIAEAAQNGVAVFIKKGLASGKLPAEQAIPFVLRNPGVTSLVIGTLKADHIAANLRLARREGA